MRRSLRPLCDAALAPAARLAAYAFFREIEVVGVESIPRGRPLLLVANHENNLIDPLLLLGFLGLRPRFLAKSPLFRHPLVGPFLALTGSLPVYRRQDRGADLRRNTHTFSRCGGLLARGETVAVFPEGTSHNRPHRLPVKTGAARIVLEALAEHGPLGLLIVPVGLTYEDKARFRSRVLVQVGAALDPSPEAARFAADPRGAARELTERIATALREVTLNHGSWEEAHLVARAAALLAAGGAAARPGLSEQWTLQKWIRQEYEALQRTAPARAAALAEELARYDRGIVALGLPSAELAMDLPAARARAGYASLGRSIRGLVLALLALPAVLGVVLAAPAYFAIRWLVVPLAHTPDQPATYKLMAAVILYPLSWMAAAGLAWRVAGGAAALAVFLLAPVLCWFAVDGHDRLSRWRAERRLRRLPPDTRKALALLQDDRRRLHDTLTAEAAQRGSSVRTSA
jgi:glycerol-3-phosphate O-acyltransferase/dihydroxyacetone phosphate acyltransferase